APVALELLAQDHRQRRGHALAELEVLHDHRDRAVLADAQERIRRHLRRLRRLGEGKPPAGGHPETDDEAAGESGGRLLEFATRDAFHGQALFNEAAALVIASRALW